LTLNTGTDGGPYFGQKQDARRKEEEEKEEKASEPYTLRPCIYPYPAQPYKRRTPYTLHTYPTTTYLLYIPRLPLQTYKTLHTYPTPTYLHYPYNPYNPYSTTHPTPYTAGWLYPCTPAASQWAYG